MSLHVLLETVFISRTGMSLRLDGDSLTVHEERRLLRRLPLASISAIVVFGPNHVSSKLIERCGLDGHSIAWFDRRGRFIGRLQGPRQGNVLLARDQHVALSDPQSTLEIARSFVDAKLLNSTRLIERYGRERNVQSQLAVG